MFITIFCYFIWFLFDKDRLSTTLVYTFYTKNSLLLTFTLLTKNIASVTNHTTNYVIQFVKEWVIEAHQPDTTASPETKYGHQCHMELKLMQQLPISGTMTL
ncbi:hypothetical protein ACJW30_09G130000 [Castanea mollissima]